MDNNYCVENLISTESIEVGFLCDNKNDAIRKAGELLLQGGFVKETYINAMIKTCEELGPYIVLIPGFAMPHARSEEGALKTGISILTLAKPVIFDHPDNDPVRLLIGLSSYDNDAHMKLISFLSNLIMDSSFVDEITSCATKDEVFSRMLEYEKNYRKDN